MRSLVYKNKVEKIGVLESSESEKDFEDTEDKQSRNSVQCCSWKCDFEMDDQEVMSRSRMVISSSWVHIFKSDVSKFGRVQKMATKSSVRNLLTCLLHQKYAGDLITVHIDHWEEEMLTKNVIFIFCGERHNENQRLEN